MAFPVKTVVPSPYARELYKKIAGDLGSTLQDDASAIIIDLTAAIYEAEDQSTKLNMTDTALAAIVTACTDV